MRGISSQSVTACLVIVPSGLGYLSGDSTHFPYRSRVIADNVTETSAVSGVGTHKDLHVAAVVDQSNIVLVPSISPPHGKGIAKCWHGWLRLEH